MVSHGLNDAGMLIGWRLAVVVDINGGIHDPLHLAAHVADRLQQQLITAQCSQADVEGGIGFNEAFVALAIIFLKMDLPKPPQFLECGFICTFARRQLHAGALQRRTELVQLHQLVDGHVAHEIATIRHNSQQVLLLQPHRGFANRSAAGAIALSQQVFAQRLARLKNPCNDVMFHRPVNAVAQRWCAVGGRVGAPSARQADFNSTPEGLRFCGGPCCLAGLAHDYPNHAKCGGANCSTRYLRDRRFFISSNVKLLVYNLYAILQGTAHMISEKELTGFRNRFPVFRNSIYLNSCSQGALSDAVEQGLAEMMEMWREKGSPWDLWVEQYEVLRGELGQFLNCEADEVAIVPSVSAGVSSVASAFDFRGRSTVIMGEFEFPTMGHIWMAQRQRGAKVEFLSAKGLEELPAEAYERRIDKDTVIVPVTGVCFKNGFRSDISRIAAAAHAQGAYVLLDDYQDCGTRPRNVKDLGVDFYTAGTLKYLLGASGLAFLYVRKPLISQLQPTISGWFAQEHPFDFATQRFEPAASARRFESGTPPIPNVYMALAGLRLLRDLGFDNIAAHVARLTSALLKGAQELEIAFKTPPHSVGPLVVLQSTDAQGLVETLAHAGIVCSSRHDGLRVSFHAYNTMEDVTQLLEALKRNLAFMVRSHGVAANV